MAFLNHLKLMVHQKFEMSEVPEISEDLTASCLMLKWHLLSRQNKNKNGTSYFSENTCFLTTHTSLEVPKMSSKH
jgi:hypothetical protein